MDVAKGSRCDETVMVMVIGAGLLDSDFQRVEVVLVSNTNTIHSHMPKYHSQRSSAYSYTNAQCFQETGQCPSRSDQC